MLTDGEIVAFFHRHVVALIFTFQKGSEVLNLSVTAFILSVSDQWFMITAGHCIKQIEQITDESDYTLLQCLMIDSLGLGATYFQSIPFIYKDSLPTCLSDDFAFDYGVMILSPYYRQLLEKNNIQALNEDVWRKQPSKVDLYLLLGIPGELVKVDSTKVDVNSTLHTVIPVDERPEGFTEVSMPLFYGQIALGDDITSIRGISGGPIFALHQNEKGEMRYWLIALQSRWLRHSHFIAACPTRLLGNFLEAILLRANQSSN